MPTSPLRHALLLAGLIGCLMPSAQAALTISMTRIIQASDKQSSSIIVANPSTQAFAAQSWVNTDADDTTTAVPLIATPALFRLDAGNEQTVQINRIPNDLPNDRESLFYFNLQEIPQADVEPSNTLTIALRTRIKLFYRPADLQGSPLDGLKDLQWSLQQIDGTAQLVVSNPSPYYYTFRHVHIGKPTERTRVEAREMVAPKSTQTYAVPGIAIHPGMQVTFTTINDYGGTTTERVAPIAEL